MDANDLRRYDRMMGRTERKYSRKRTGPASYSVEFVARDLGYRHVTSVKSGQEAIRTARAVYAALYVAMGVGGGGGDDPGVLKEILRPACERVTVEPRNRAFTVAINKR